jgi:hypothetical protein
MYLRTLVEASEGPHRMVDIMTRLSNHCFCHSAGDLASLEVVVGVVVTLSHPSGLLMGCVALLFSS